MGINVLFLKISNLFLKNVLSLFEDLVTCKNSFDDIFANDDSLEAKEKTEHKTWLQFYELLEN